MKIKKTKLNKGFVILFAVTISAILLSIALGVSNIALKEIRFGTSAKDTVNALSAADAGIECALLYDKSSASSNAFTGTAGAMSCSGNSFSPTESPANFWTFVVPNIGSSLESCAKVTVDKTTYPITRIISKGYNVGNVACDSANPNRIERELGVSYSSSAIFPAFRSSAQAGAASGVLSLVINKPAGTTQDDVMIASLGVRPSTAVITPPAGWALVRRINNGAAGGTSNSLAIYSKVAGSSEPANYSWTFNTSLGSAGGIMSFFNTDTVTPINVEDGQNTPETSLSSPTPSVNTTVANTLVVTIHSIPSSPTWTPPSGMTEAVDVSNLTPFVNGGQSVEMNYVAQTSIGATGVKTATQNTSGGQPGLDYGNAQILVLQP